MNIARTPAEEAYASLDNLPGGFEDIRKKAVTAVAKQGLPHRRIEEWKWTDLKRLVDQAYPPVAGGKVDAKTLAGLAARSVFADLASARLVFINGCFDTGRSVLPEGISIETLAAASTPDLHLKEKDPIDALNLAFASDGAVISVTGKHDAPVELLFITAPDHPATVTTRNIIKLEPGASLTLLETHTGHDEPYVASTASEIHLEDGASLNRVRLLEDGAGAIHLSNTIASLHKGANLRDFTFTLGGKTVRNQGFVNFNGEGASANVSGAYMLAGKQHVDTTLLVNHAVPGCTSRELFKCVMDENSRGIFQGKVIVAPGAQKTDGQQSADALLLADGAEFDAKPELEIYADDVWCGHGATSGELDENQMFYLKTRGLPHARAKALLIAAFAASAFEEIDNDAVRDAFNRLAHGWLERRTG